MERRSLTFGGLLFFTCVLQSVASTVHHKYCIVGAGPGGLQVGYFMQQSKRDYVVFESGNSPGTFFKTYPRHDTLISINKIYTGQKNTEFNFRHDWNSLISHDPELKFPKYTRELFPHRKHFVRYLADYQKKLNIRVQFNTTVSNIRKVDNLFFMEDQHNKGYSCRILIMATGIATPYLPKFNGVQHTVGYEDMSLNPEDYAGKSVLIIGKGNAAFETAAHIYGHTNVVHLVSRERLRLAWETHYVGDLRAVNNALLDTYQLKSLDGLFETDMEGAYLHKMPNGEMALLSNAGEVANARQKSQGYTYDVVIRCMGWTFDFNVFNKSSIKTTRPKGRRKKYPRIHSDYQSWDTPDMYVAGTAGHSVDWRKSAGGFVHGFRYTARTLFRILDWRYERQPWTTQRYPITSLVDHLTRRVNEASGLYQMFAVLADVAVLSTDRTSYQYIEEYPVADLHKLEENTGVTVAGPVIVFIFEYGRNFSGPGKDPFREDRADSSVSTAFKSNFLHPVYYHYEVLPNEEQMKLKRREDILPRPDRLHHTIEDFFTDFRKRQDHVLPLQRFIEHAIGQDLASYSAERCLSLALTSHSLPLACREQHLNPLVSTSFQIS